jgi:3-hydroxyisobutyrate dehydrogenase-like beta-hydroxyacid dehydrogenase
LIQKNPGCINSPHGLITAVIFASFPEGLLLAEQLGIDPDRFSWRTAGRV